MEGLLVLARSPGAPVFDEQDRTLVRLLATLAAQSINVQRTWAGGLRVARAGNRQEVAREAHDAVVQALYGLGMSLERARKRSEQPALRGRLGLVVVSEWLSDRARWADVGQCRVRLGWREEQAVLELAADGRGLAVDQDRLRTITEHAGAMGWRVAVETVPETDAWLRATPAL